MDLWMPYLLRQSKPQNIEDALIFPLNPDLESLEECSCFFWVFFKKLVFQ